MRRRDFLEAVVPAALVTGAAGAVSAAPPPGVVKPPRLRAGDVVGLALAVRSFRKELD